MSYFNRFPLLAYSANNNAVVNIVSDVLRRVTVNQKTKENLVIFDEYDIQDGETPEIVSYKFYDTTDYHWVILIVNDILDPRFGWPLTDEQLYTYTANKYGSANVNATHHYVAFEGSDIVVDPTQTKVTKVLEASYVDLFRMAANGFISTTENQQAFIDYLYSPKQPAFSSPRPRADISHSGSPAVSSGDGLLALRYQNNSSLTPQLISHINYFIIKPLVLSYPNLVPLVLESSTTLPEERNSSNAYVTDGSVFYWLTPDTEIVTSDMILQISVSNLSGTAEVVEYKNFLSSNVLTYYPKGDVTADTLGYITELDVANVSTYLTTGLYDTPALANVKDIIDSVDSIQNFSPFLETTELAYPNAYEVTNISYESEINETKRRIRVLKNEYISAFVTEFERLVNG